MILKPEGGFIDTWLTDHDGDWATNEKDYAFGPFEERGFRWAVEKHGDGSAKVEVTGPFGQSFVFDDIARIPPSPGSEKPGKRVMLMIEWKEGTLRVRLNMVVVKTHETKPAPA